MRNLTDTVKHLIIINVLFFMATALLPFDLKELFSRHFPLAEGFRPFQIITSVFMHADIQHLAFNMLSLYFLGPFVEQALGAKRFLILYLGSAIFAVIASTGVDYYLYSTYLDRLSTEDINTVLREGREALLQGKNFVNPVMAELNFITSGTSLGASGGVYGILAAFAAMFPNMKLMLLIPPIPIKAKYMALGLVVIGLISGIGGFQQGIGHFAHVGGAVAGFLFIVYWNKLRLR